MEEKTLFARKATGLVREIGLTTAIILAVCNAVGLGWQKRVFQAIGAESVHPQEYVLGIHPMVMAFFLIGILMLVSIYAFAVLSSAMPRSGGGYVFMSRIINPAFSFVATCLEFLSVAISYGLIAVATFEATLIFGSLAGVDTSAFANPWFMSIFGIVIIAIFSGIACLGTRMTGYVLHVMFWIPAGILAVVYLVFLLANPTAMEAGVGAIYPGVTATQYTQAAIDQGMASSGIYWSAVFAASFYAYWAYIGYAAATFVAGEVKEASRSLPKAIFVSGIVIMGIYMSISFLLARAGSMAGVVDIGGGRTWSLIDAVGFLTHGGGSFDAAGLPAVGAWMPYFAGISAYGVFGVGMGKLFGILMLAMGTLWVANDIPPFILTCSRMLFAMGFDRILPEWVADINERRASPVNAIIVTSVAALVGVVAEAELFGTGGLNLAFLHHPFGQNFINSAGAIVATDLWDALFFGGMGLACALFPSRLPEVFERAPWRQSRGMVVGMGWAAFATNALLSLLILTHSAGYGWGPITVSLGPLGSFGGNFASLNFWFTVVLILVSLGVYYWGRSRARRVGADLTTIFAQIPPE